MRRTLLAVAGLIAPLLGCGPAPGRDLPRLHFTDVTAASGLHMRTTSGAARSTQILEVKGGGLALIDFDSDGDHDLFVPNGATLEQPSEGPGGRLWENLGGMRFRDATEAAGLSFRRWGYGCAVGDVDGDGDEDLFVACYGRDALLVNEGGRLAERTELAGLADERWSSAAAFGDVDRDGDLDLYVARFLEFDVNAPPRPMNFMGVEVFGGPMGLSPAADSLYLNRGDGTFEEVTAGSGIADVEPAFGLGVLILDFDADGWPEIFVGNDSGKNFLFHRSGPGRFVERGIASGIATDMHGGEQATMGIALGDVVGDGLADVYTTNFMADVNTLHVNLGGLLFDDRGARHGLGVEARPFLGWAAAFADLDLDADEDLIVFNGHVYPEAITSEHGWKHRQTPLLYERVGGRFERRTGDAGEWLSAEHCDRGAVFDDLDGDGDVDMVVSELNGALRVLENDGARGDWLLVRLDDPGSPNRRGLGARVELVSGGVRQTRWIHGAGGYQSANPPQAHFGLPALPRELLLTVVWPDGERQEARVLERNRRVTVTRE